MGARTVNYTILQGIPLNRIIVVKSRQRHRLMVPTDVRAQVQTGPETKKDITATITGSGEILLSLTEDETAELPLGDLEYDVLAQYDGIYYKISNGVIAVEANNTVTEKDEAQAMEIRFKQRTDFRRTFTWNDADGNLIEVQNAYMQAKSAGGTLVLDLAWFATMPFENEILDLDPEKRGYLAPIEDATLELHISDANSISAGSHNFDLFVQDTSGDWDCLASGTVVVDAAISTPPVG
jgi:hypothetical protein